jgi:hypothetical protein
MRRRDLLAAVALATANLGGCYDFDGMYSTGMLSAADLGTCPEGERDGGYRPGRETDGPVRAFVRNDSEAPQRIAVELTRAGNTHVDDDFEVESGDRRALFDEAAAPTLTGEYRLSIVVEDGSRLTEDWRVCHRSEALTIVVSAGGGLGFERSG